MTDSSQTSTARNRKAATRHQGDLIVKRLFGWIVLIGMIVFGLSYVAGHSPSGNKFGCGAAGAAVAHADTTDCPTNIVAADDDSRWAAERYDTIKGSK